MHMECLQNAWSAQADNHRGYDMDTHRFFTPEGKSLHFHGRRIAIVRSDPISTSRGEVWYELTALIRDNHQWVTAIAIRNSTTSTDEVFAFYSSALLSSAEDFLYDFEPVRSLPDDLIAGGCAQDRPLIAAADQSYYAAVRKLTGQMAAHDHERLQERRASGTSADIAPTSPIRVIGQLRGWLHI